MRVHRPAALCANLTGEAVKTIIDGTYWVRAVVEAGFIYRGVAEASPTLRRDPYDLSLYVQFARAATYFRSLDAALDKTKAPGPWRTAHRRRQRGSRVAVGHRSIHLAPRRDSRVGPHHGRPAKAAVATACVDEGLADHP